MKQAMRAAVRFADAVVVGSGCAGWATAQRLAALGVKTLLVTEGVNSGTSRNTGSDKQTYYKLSLAGDAPDSVTAMARDLYEGSGMDGDLALCQAALSARAFYRLCELGVPFPSDAYGQYPGYQTDHDRRGRATSAGPLTSRYMTEALERAARQAGVEVWDRCGVVELIQRDGRCAGLISLDLNPPSRGGGALTAIVAGAVVLCTGGSAICYRDSVYPGSQTGMLGLALRAGATGANLDQWQYGLASTQFRWNVSGSYQQVLPRYVSVDERGVQREFLADALGAREALRLTFLKGYEWPFDAAKADASSRVDLLVHQETQALGRSVYLDFRSEPRGLDADFALLSEEARDYLTKSGALEPVPFNRLRRMNPQSAALYAAHGIDLAQHMLKIAVCAQHMNGGLMVDADWQTTLPGLYAVGECAGTFGARRPGGSALNATQVGALRASAHIARAGVAPAAFDPEPELAMARARMGQAAPDGLDTVKQRAPYQAAMSGCAAHLRRLDQMRYLEASLYEALAETAGGARVKNAYAACKTRDMLHTQAAALSAMCASARSYGTRGAALVLDCPKRPETGNSVLETVYRNGRYDSVFRAARPIPESDLWFESVWRKERGEPT